LARTTIPAATGRVEQVEFDERGPDAIVEEVRTRDLDDRLLHWVAPEPSAFIFTGPKAEALPRATFNTAWDRARCVVGAKHLHFHDLRHTGNTLAASTGASTKELMARMGHASTRAALIYQHATEERDVAIADGLSEIALKILQRPAR
jgi:integrase